MEIVDKIYEINFENLKKTTINLISENEINNNTVKKNTINIKYYQKTGLTVYYNNTKYEFICYFIENCDDILILCPGFLNEEKSKKLYNKPVFDRHTWFKDFHQNLIYCNDPTRYDFKELKGGWGIGTVNNWHLDNISKIIKVLANKICQYSQNEIIPYTNLYFYGSSMGGFMGIMLSILIKNSTSIADIPQFNVLKWHYWYELQSKCFKNLNFEEIYVNYSYRLIVHDLIRKEQYIPNAYIVLDCSCQKDWDNQFKDFLENLNLMPYKCNSNINKIHLRIEGKNRGHSVLKKTKTINLITSVINHEKKFNDSNSYIKFKVLSELGYDYYKFSDHKVVNENIKEFSNKVKSWGEIKTDIKTRLNDDDLDISYQNNLKKEIQKDFKDIIFEDLKKYYTCRIDIKNEGNENNSVELINSSEDISIKYPSWFKNKKGKGLILTSTSLNLDLYIKCKNKGILKINLRGKEFKKDSQGKRLPIFIDITFFEVSGKQIINDSQVICHDKPIRFQKEVVSDEIINIKIKWRPLSKYSNITF